MKQFVIQVLKKQNCLLQNFDKMIKYGELINEKWVYLFFSHSRCGFQEKIYYIGKGCQDIGNYFIKNILDEIIPSIDELKKMLGSNNYIHLMKKKQYGVLTIFLPCSDHSFYPELHWPKFQALFGNVNTDCLEFKSNVVQNPHILNQVFTERTEVFVKQCLYNIGGRERHSYCFEYAAIRGAIYYHGLEKSKIDPGFCNFAFKAILATENREARMEVNDPMPNEQRHVLQQGLEAEKIKCN